MADGTQYDHRAATYLRLEVPADAREVLTERLAERAAVRWKNERGIFGTHEAAADFLAFKRGIEFELSARSPGELAAYAVLLDMLEREL
jgi:hypothetical protein